VSGPTFEVRLGKRGEDVSLNDPVWDVMAYYMAQALMQSTMTLRPSKFVLGGSVVNDTFLKKIRQQYKLLINDYISLPSLEDYIVRPLVENNGSATIGNFALAIKQIQQE